MNAEKIIDKLMKKLDKYIQWEDKLIRQEKAKNKFLTMKLKTITHTISISYAQMEKIIAGMEKIDAKNIGELNEWFLYAYAEDPEKFNEMIIDIIVNKLVTEII